MMGAMDLGLLERESERGSLIDRDPGPCAQLISHSSVSEPHPRGGYAPEPSRGAVLATIVALHIVAIGALATARYQASDVNRQPRVTSFAIQEPPPPPPVEPLPSEPAIQAVSAPIAAPVTAIELPREVPVQAVQPEAVRPAITPVTVVVNDTLPTRIPAKPAPAAPAPIVPPDFSAAQLRNPGPAYPYLSRRAKEEGVVLLKVLVSTDGRAAKLEIEESSGFERLDDAALKTVGKWRFVPATQAGQPREAWVLVPVTFSLG